ncbi:nucleoside-diphosphate-sugar epimerase [Bernardetia litoralis DSM 6794]|uniref:Nucleoside-diphosphate-sugar epimerase n=1 Tax=Bernardetia litoralis (strain ATCC 23117 / DSM 6794 / NBRC 15988 / NCIMB 1366 / Fx l1 / Sio-4) TaxID=880071 RepID=I4AIS1_BERLS|nr:SDR family oxidoreductase [Bernardetia litoralis]AFM03856.1 nucleoside-diphosphate-sugar epimerase [Bernardetia litoralis DSM 6794]
MEQNKLTSKKILITGGAGFIGSNLCEKFLAQNNTVICLDNFSMGRRENIEHLLENPNFTLIEGDIRKLEDCKKAVVGVEVILHQAALGSVPRSIADPITSNDVNISGFVNVLVAAKEEGVKRIVYAASSSTYGDHKALPKIEENIGRPLSPYAVTKYVNELYANVFSDLYGLEIIGLRYFNVFGRKQRPDGAYAAVIPKFIGLLMEHERPTIFGDGEFSRDFTYIENVLQANELAATTTNLEAINQVYNVAFGERTTVTEMFELMRSLLSKYDSKISEVEAIYGDNRQGDIPHSLASIEKAKNLLGYNPQYSFKKGLTEAIEWYWKDLTMEK